jgi:hypothetical protein
MKSSNHPLNLHRPISIFSSTTIFPWLISTLQSNSDNCVVAPNVFKITPRHGPRTENTCHMFAISPVHWRAGCSLQKTHVTWQLRTVAVTSLHLRKSVFTEPFPRNGLHKPVVLLLRVGPCLRSRCLAICSLYPLNSFALYNDLYTACTAIISYTNFRLRDGNFIQC